MRPRQHGRSTARQRPIHAFTLLELLVVIAISALLIAIILPALSAARETANISKCLASLLEIVTTSVMYMDDEGYATQPWHLGWNYKGLKLGMVTEFIYGGFQAEIEHPVRGDSIDVRQIHTNERPYNRYISPYVCAGPVRAYVCPSDRFTVTPDFDDPCEPPDLNEAHPSWVVNGNSYAMNWNWLDAPPWQGKRLVFDGDIGAMSAAGSEMLRLKVGGAASEFILFMENPMNAYMQGASLPGDDPMSSVCPQELSTGWHKRFSRYSMAFLDGHAEYRFIDTRLSRGAGYNIWPESYAQPLPVP